jgi:hypothetical protein
MFFIYIDESGDDGIPGSSPAFINTAVQIQSTDWDSANKAFLDFRTRLEKNTKLSRQYELHINRLISRKKPYDVLQLSDDEITTIIFETAKFIATMPILCTTVVIDKTRLRNSYTNVFNSGVDRLINRINVTIAVQYKHLTDQEQQFLIFCDEGRNNNWVKLINNMKVSNKIYVPDKKNYIKIPLDKLIEDPIPRNSSKSNFLQIADFVVTMHHKYHMLSHETPRPSSRRGYITFEMIDSVMKTLLPVMNLDATKSNHPYGCVYYPK